jgi:tetratricopeptide (TPR) repeat protein
MAQQDWYSASELLRESLMANPSHAEGTFDLAECYYELGEFDEALDCARRARLLARSDMSVANLEAVTLIALGRLDEASSVIAEILSREPNNLEALFASGELDVARGRPSDALARYSGALTRFPDDRRLLLSLALISGALGDSDSALSFINRAVLRHPDDSRVFYYAAYVNAQAGLTGQAISNARTALRLRPDYAMALSLLGNLMYVSGDFAEAERLAGQAITADRSDMAAWYLRGLSLMRLGQNGQAIDVFANALAIDSGSEFIRFALDEALISSTPLEDARRSRWASWYFGRARDFRSRNLMGQALFEYQRGLRLNPFAPERRDYAELLRLQGYPARFTEELRFMQQNLGMGGNGIDDTLEAYDSTLSAALLRTWQIDPLEIDGRQWKLAVFSTGPQAASAHVDAATTAAGLVREVLVHDRAIATVDLDIRPGSFAQAFRSAREAGADYFMMISAGENERDISLKGELFVARTGSPAGTFQAFRTGGDRLRNAARGIVDQTGAALPFRAQLAARRQAQGLIDSGRTDGVKAGDVFSIIRKGQLQTANQGIGLVYDQGNLAGTITIDSVDEEVAAGTISASGFFDRIEAGDELILQETQDTRVRAETPANPELRSMLRALRPD